jgi:hypothetical protein
MRHLSKLLAALGIAAALAVTALAAPDTPVRIITVGPPAVIRPSGTAPRDLLADRLGAATATSPATVPDGDVSRLADRLARVDSAVRQYGDLRVAVFQMADESVAYVFMKSLEPAGSTTTDVGDDAWAGAAGGFAVRAGAYVGLIEGGTPDSRRAAATELVGRIGQQPVRAPFARVLPADGRVAGSERYVASFDGLRRLRPDLSDDVYRLGAGGADAVLADYTQSGGALVRLLVVQYQTPQLAADAERSLQAYYAALPADVKAHRVFRREGNYLVEATGVTDVDAATAVSKAVKYDVSIKMLEGPDPVSVRSLTDEAQKAAAVFLNSFAIVGLCFLMAVGLGLVVGSVIFQRRRRASAEVFSDAGGMTHLDLGPVAPRLGRSAEPIGLLQSGQGD